MKKIFIATFIILLMQVAALGQVTIQPAIPAVGLIQKNQLWNVLVVNGTNANYKCILQLVLRDRTTGMEILTASTGQFDVGTGVKQLSANLLNPIQYNYLLAGIDNRLQGLLPAGTYTACYELSNVYPKPEKLAEECVQFDAEPLSPPMLIFPADSAVLENAPVQFSWMPPTPEGMFDRLRYEVLITEVKDGQRPDEAIQQNIPFYNDGALFANRMNYPASAAAIEKNKWYAWQVVARDDKAYAGKSEVWLFKVAATNNIETMAKTYVTLSNNQNEFGAYNLSENQVGIKYYSFEKNFKAKIQILSSDGKLKKELQQDIMYGENLFTVKFDNSIKKDETYRLELMTAAGNKKTFLFTIVNTGE